MKTIMQQKYLALYLAIETIIDEQSFSPLCVEKEEIESLFEDLRNEFDSILTDTNMKDLEEAENVFNEYYDNFDNYSVDESDTLLYKAKSLLKKVAPLIPEYVADKLL